MEVKDVLQRAKNQLAAATGLDCCTVTRVMQAGEGWLVRVEMVEMHRIPTSTDVLGEYEVVLSEDGAMIRFERQRTRLRGEPVEVGGAA